MTTATIDGITERQASYIRALVAEVREEPVDEEGLALLSKKTASAMIDALLKAKAEKQMAAQIAKASEAEWVDPEVTDAGQFPAPNQEGPVLPQGYFTVVLEGEGHRTFRVKDASAQSKLHGKRIISFLAGPDNTSDYNGFGFVTASGVQVWSRFKTQSVLTDAVDILLGDVEAAQKGYAMASGNCYICGRLLTDPTSIELGIGPKCREG